MNTESVRVTILHHGEPIGTSDLTITPPFVVGTLEPLAGYATLRSIFRDKARAMRNLGFLPPHGHAVGGVNSAGDAAGQAAIARASAVCEALQLRADDGSVVTIESLEIADLDEQSEIAVLGYIPHDVAR